MMIISDLHCMHSTSDFDENKKSARSTILYSDLLRRDTPPKHPVHALLDIISKNGIDFKSDILLCPGDITDKIDYQGYITGWSFLEEIKEAIEAPNLYATVGNHDVDSRRHDPRLKPFTVAQAIKYNYPVEESDKKADFWNDQFCIIENKNYILLIFNSSHSHLSYDDAKRAYIEDDVIKKMETKLKFYPSDKIRIALCHHHPIGQSNISTPDLDVIEKGIEFLEMLCRNNFSMIIHGHKHEIKIRYYNSLVVFGAGSFSSKENLDETESDNVFHVIEFFNNKDGLIKTWFYGSNSGWNQKANKKFPPLSGFGFNGAPNELEDLANKIFNWFTSISNGSNDLYSNLIKNITEVQLLIPAEHEKLRKILDDKFKIDITYDEDGIPTYVSKIIT